MPTTKEKPDYLAQIAGLEAAIKKAKHDIQILETKRKLEHLEKGGELCATCNGIVVFRYGNVMSRHHWARCERCQQTSIGRPPDWGDDPDEWPPEK